jgi:hypothetical protein
MYTPKGISHSVSSPHMSHSKKPSNSLKVYQDPLTGLREIRKEQEMKDMLQKQQQNLGIGLEMPKESHSNFRKNSS